MNETNPNKEHCEPIAYFKNPKNTAHRQYAALRAFFYDGRSAKDVAKQFGYKTTAFYSLIRDFKANLKNINSQNDPFFISKKVGRKEKTRDQEIRNTIIVLRKRYLSVPDIKTILDTKKMDVNERYIYKVLQSEGFGRLPRRDKIRKNETLSEAKYSFDAPKSEGLNFEPEEFNSDNIGPLCFIPLLDEYGITKIIQESAYPSTSSISKISSILSFLCLKLSNIRRYNADDLWCMDRGMGLFASLNVLPKTGWFSSYSHRVTRGMNLKFLKNLHSLWRKKGLLSDTINLDFTTIPYWGDDDHLENNWSGKRHKSLASMLAVIAQDPDSGIIDYGATDVRHANESNVVLEFLDFYREGQTKKNSLKYLVFDSKFTSYENLSILDGKNVKFITIRRRGKKEIDRIKEIERNKFHKIHVMNADGKGRTLKVLDEKITLNGYKKEIRQIIITGHGKIKPALLITNDFKMSLEDVVRKYSRRWIVEKEISEQIEFFHLNRVSSSVVIKVDFDLTMTILAHNLIRLLAMRLDGYSHQADITIFEKFYCNSGYVKITGDTITVQLKKKRHLPLLLSVLKDFQNKKVPWLRNKKIRFEGATTS